ncbi:MAG: ATPase, T2SS/T4P/T4SS family [Pseudomonadota bacterium]
MEFEHGPYDIEAILIEEGLLSLEELNKAREIHKSTGRPLEEVLISENLVSEDELLKIISKRMNTSFVSLSKYKADVDVVGLLPLSVAKSHSAIPLFKIEDKVTIAMANPLDLTALDDIRAAIGCEVTPIFALATDIDRAIRENYRGISLTEADAAPKVEIVGSLDNEPTDDAPVENLQKAASGEKIVTTVNNVISRAFEDRASDIHLEPSRSSLRIRFRIDGILEDIQSLPKEMHLPIVSRVKIMGNMDVAERRLPQDGRIRVRIQGKELDMRIATYPTMFGEAVAIRLLSKDQLLKLEDMGFVKDDMKKFETLIKKPHGIFLVTGPTGSGKSTTLYGALMQINSRDKHILSVEDPIEHEIIGIDQQQVNVKAGMTFASSLRSMLRQDPDVIMVGEIRDHETAELALQAAMTGHLVFSTLHTNSSIGAIVRLKDLGIEPYLISTGIIGVMAQRLARRICQDCKIEIEPSREILKYVSEKHNNFKSYKGQGCKKCHKTGYYGRVGLFEILDINDDIRSSIEKNVTEAVIREKVEKTDFHSMLEDGIEKVKAGITTADEVLRILEE